MHKNISERVGIQHPQTYPYYNRVSNSLVIPEMVDFLKKIPERSIIFMHPCAHNPTGLDPTQSEWDAILNVCQEKQHYPFFDFAYQGLASGSLTDDARVISKFVDAGMQMAVTHTMSTNAGIYGEKVGYCHFVCTDATTSNNVLSQLKMQVRRSYSACPVHGARIAARILRNPEYFEMWKGEIKEMHGRLVSVRKDLKERLIQLKTPGNWEFLEKQNGLFSSLGLQGK